MYRKLPANSKFLLVILLFVLLPRRLEEFRLPFLEFVVMLSSQILGLFAQGFGNIPGCPVHQLVVIAVGISLGLFLLVPFLVQYLGGIDETIDQTTDALQLLFIYLGFDDMKVGMIVMDRGLHVGQALRRTLSLVQPVDYTEEKVRRGTLGLDPLNETGQIHVSIGTVVGEEVIDDLVGLGISLGFLRQKVVMYLLLCLGGRSLELSGLSKQRLGFGLGSGGTKAGGGVPVGG